MAGGRKIEFDRTSALNAAMKIFWLKGYTGASLSDLTESMGINKPSMYSAFGNKESLFIEATQHYLAQYSGEHQQMLSEPHQSLKIRLKTFLMSILAVQCDESLPRGCMVMLSTGEAASGCLPEKATQVMSKAADYIPECLGALLEHDPEAKALGLDQHAAKHALFLATVLNGTSTMARNHKTLQELESVIDTALVGIGLSEG